jgi:hypothetical protein
MFLKLSKSGGRHCAQLALPLDFGFSSGLPSTSICCGPLT